MMLSAILIPLLNASSKYLTQFYPVVEITWARYAGHFAFMVLVFAPRRGTRLLVSSRPMLQLLRSTLLCLSSLIYISALTWVALPTATAISFTGPMIVTALAPFLLGERVGRTRWLAVGTGFLGAVVIVRPGMDSANQAALLVLASAFASALYQILTRKLASQDPAETSITYIALAGFVLTSVPLPFVWVTPASLWDTLVFVGLGLFGGFGHYFLVRAFELAPAPVVSPFNYGQLIGAGLLSYSVFGQVPDAWTWIGAAVIVASGIFMLYAERRRRGAERASTTPAQGGTAPRPGPADGVEQQAGDHGQALQGADLRLLPERRAKHAEAVRGPGGRKRQRDQHQRRPARPQANDQGDGAENLYRDIEPGPHLRIRQSSGGKRGHHPREVEELVDARRQEQRRHEHAPEQQGRVVTALEHVSPPVRPCRGKRIRVTARLPGLQPRGVASRIHGLATCLA
jgi:drug/metabolite transporter (DMT)-like permease